MESATKSSVTQVVDPNDSNAEEVSHSVGGEQLGTEQQNLANQMRAMSGSSKRPPPSEGEPEVSHAKKRRKQSNPVRVTPQAGPSRKESDDEEPTVAEVQTVKEEPTFVEEQTVHEEQTVDEQEAVGDEVEVYGEKAGYEEEVLDEENVVAGPTLVSQAVVEATVVQQTVVEEGTSRQGKDDIHNNTLSAGELVVREDQDIRCESQAPTGSFRRTETEPGQESPSHCPYCPEFLNYKDRLKFHIENGHVQKLFQNQLRNKISLDSLLPTKHDAPLNLSHISASETACSLDVVGSIMSEFQGKGDDSVQGTKPLPPATNSQNLGTFTEENLVIPPYMPLASPYIFSLISQTPAHNPAASLNQGTTCQPTGSTNQVRIFNPDAYCELCHKEFCNKYFLKTHKANKHGIYADNSSATQNGCVPGSVYTTSVIKSNSNTSYLQSPVMETQNIKNAVDIPKMSEIMTASKVTGPAVMKATCDICQKKFCNKYFVRKHKMKMHGIVDESPPTGNLLFLNLPEYNRKQESDEPGSTSAGSDTGSNAQETVHNDVPITNEPDDLRVVALQERSHQNMTEDFIEPTKVKDEPRQEERAFVDEGIDRISTAQSKCSPIPSHAGIKDTTLAPERLRRLGVINADAFCEICCKEYCNKYFLRTHKMKRHGIIYNDDGKELKIGGSHSISWSHIQSSPLNLIVGEQGTNSSDSVEKIRTELPEGDEPECDICGRKFQSFYLMQMHRAYLHSEKTEKNELGQNGSNEMESDMKGSEENVTSGDNMLRNESESGTNLIQQTNISEGNSEGCKEAISEDLQKLQTMILQLNNLNVGRVPICTVCNKKEENHYSLKTHMMTEHGIMMDDANFPDIDKVSNQQETPVVSASDIVTCCICKKDFYTKAQLKQHIEEYHSYVTLSSTTPAPLIREVKEEFEARTPPEKATQQIVPVIGSEKRISLTPTNSYCEICNKELCNKYFMKTHMQRMHGIEIENGAQIGGVICDICNKELCSKYFLRVHKQNTHGIVEEGTVSQSYSRDASTNNNIQNPTEGDQSLKSSEMNDQSQRYFTHFTEVCTICNRRFRSTKWLKSHLLNDHGELGMEKWKELEGQYHFSQQVKQQHSTRVSVSSNNHTVGQPTAYSPALNVPNNWHSNESGGAGLRGSEQRVLDHSNEIDGSRIFTNLFGNPDSAAKSYHCSYCSFSTPVLAFLFVHEKSHMGLSSQGVPETAKPFKCPICLQSFVHSEVFQHHILTHQFSGMFSPFFGSVPVAHFPTQPGNLQENIKLVHQGSPDMLEEERLKTEDKYDHVSSVVMEDESSGGKYKFKCSKCSQRFRTREVCLGHIENVHNISASSQSTPSCSVETIPVKFTSHGLYKCTRCEFSSVHMFALRKHIKQDHKAKMTRSEMRHDKRDISRAEISAISEKPGTEELKKKLQEAAMKSQVPASYAVPQNQIPKLDEFIMQPFLLEEPDGPLTSEQHPQLQLDRKFVPSLVFLPVKEKLSGPLTVSFTLTPA